MSTQKKLHKRQATDPLESRDSIEAAGWAIVVNGIDAIQVRQAEDLRSFSVLVACSDGAEREWKFAQPVVIYRGVFVDGAEYAAGDCVTWGGSMWHCNSPTKDKPGDSSSWRLSVKHGRDGRDKT